MLLHAIRRSVGIISNNPKKILMIFTFSGWKSFFGLRKERIHKNDQASILQREFEKKNRLEAFESDAWVHTDVVSVRQYESYDSYISHQKDKLDGLHGRAFANPEKAVNMFRRRFELIDMLPKNSAVLCLGARCGEEVQAFISLGHFALGVDLNPGQQSKYVVTGDFHKLQFSESSVECVYVNCLDHALDIGKIMDEVSRVLKPGGFFVADVVYGFEEGYVAGNHDTMHWRSAEVFSRKLADLAQFKFEKFQDLTAYGSPLWTQAIMRKP